MTEQIQGIIEVKKGYKMFFYKIGFWFLALTLLGFIGGLYFAQHYIIDRQLASAVTLQGIVIDNIPFDLKRR